MSNAIFHDLDINADASSIFEAVSEPKHLNNWWTKKCSGGAELNAKYNLYFTEEYDWYGEVETCKSDEEFAIKMTSTMPEWEGTVFGFKIEEIDKSMTRLSLYHKGWKENTNEFRSSSYCWALLLKGLKDYLENGTILKFEDRSC